MQSAGSTDLQGACDAHAARAAPSPQHAVAASSHNAAHYDRPCKRRPLPPVSPTCPLLPQAQPRPSQQDW
eukprot:508208-Prymnesium_polylepis.2